MEELPGPAMIFPGLFCSGLVAHPWLNDSEILLSSLCRSKQLILKVDVQTHLLQIFDPFLSDHVEATSGDPHHSLSVSDVWSPYVLFTRSSFSAPPAAFLSSYHDGVVSWTSRLTPHQPAPCDGAKTQLLTFTPSGQSSSLQSDSFEAFLVTSPSSAPSSSLIVLPHGGPHGTFVPYFSVTLMTFLLSGYDLFFVNYRGSLGFGQRSVESLPGFVGINDVADVYQATQQVQSAYKSLFVHGGSHGGFLAGHLVGQYPDLFKAACLRNPVINIASMVSGSDIRDWCFAEACGLDAQSHSLQTLEHVQKMHTCSPIAHAHRVKTPCLIFIGQEDQRVPSYQGVEFHFVLKSQGVPTRLISYADSHALTKVPHDFDAAINALEWFTTHQ